MCDFARPAFLWLSLLVPLVLWRWFRRHRGGLRYSDTALLADLPADRSRWIPWIDAALRCTGLLLLIIGLAGPRWPDRQSRILTEGIGIQMVVDVSGSMAERDFDWHGQPLSRLDAVKKVFHLFVEGGSEGDDEILPGRSTDQIGLVTFATWPESPCPLTLSHAVLLRLLDAEQPRRLPTESQTNIGDAIAWGLIRLKSVQAERSIMILLSDGEHNVPPPALSPRQAAPLAANQGVTIYTIDAGGPPQVEESGLGLEGPEKPEASIRASGEQTLQTVANITGGKCFRAHDTHSLLAVCRDIDRLERKDIPSFLYRRFTEGYPWTGVGALVLWVLVLILEMTFWQRLP